MQQQPIYNQPIYNQSIYNQPCQQQPCQQQPVQQPGYYAQQQQPIIIQNLWLKYTILTVKNYSLLFFYLK